MTAPPNPDRSRVLLGLFVGAAMVYLALWAILVNAAQPAVSDEAVYLWQARLHASGRLSGPIPQHAEFFVFPNLLVHDGRRFGTYPIGYPLALAPWVLAGIPWALNVLLAGASLLLLHRLVKKTDGGPSAWTAVLLTAASPFFLAQSTVCMSHPLTLFLTLVAFVALAEREASARPERWAALAGAAIGYAGNVSAFVAIPMAVVLIERWIAARRPTRREVAAAFVPILAGAALAAFVNWRTTGSPTTPAYYLNRGQKFGFGDAIESLPFTPAMAVVNTRDRLASLNEALFAWPGTSFLFIAVYAALAAGRLAMRPPRASSPASGQPALPPSAPPASWPSAARWDLPLALHFIVTLGIYFFYFGPGVNTIGPRYLYATMPSLIVFTTRGIAALRDILARAFARHSSGRRLAASITAVLVGILFVSGTLPYLTRLPSHEHSRARRGARVFLDEIDRRGIDEGLVLLETRDHVSMAALLCRSDFDERARLVFAPDLGEARNKRLLRSRRGTPTYYARRNFETLGWDFADEADPAGDGEGGSPRRWGAARGGETSK